MGKLNSFVFKRGFKTKAENLAVELRQKLGIHPCAPLSSFKLAEHLNVSIFCVSDIVEDKVDLKKIMGNTLVSHEFSGVHFTNADGINIILHNGNHSEVRKESNIMHELAHIICKHAVPNEYLDIPIAFGMRYYCEEHEEEAKYLGGCLQITRAGLLWAVKKSMNIDEIAKYFTASVDMVKYRLNITGVAKQISRK